jgi:hypothetical protein
MQNLHRFKLEIERHIYVDSHETQSTRRKKKEKVKRTILFRMTVQLVGIARLRLILLALNLPTMFFQVAMMSHLYLFVYKNIIND